MKVRDLMVPLDDYAVIGVDDTLRDAAIALRRVYCQVEYGRCTEGGHRTILALDHARKLVGIVDFKSILRVLMPEIAGGLTERLESLGVSVAYAQADASELDEAKLGFRARVVKNAQTKVGDVMLKVRERFRRTPDSWTPSRPFTATRSPCSPCMTGTNSWECFGIPTCSSPSRRS
jgi:CBS domain-containing protein